MRNESGVHHSAYDPCVKSLSFVITRKQYLPL